MPYTIPARRYVDNELVHDVKLNELSDLINFPPWVYVQRATAFPIVNGASYVNIPWETELVDNDGMWSVGNPTAFVCQHSFVGRVHAKVQWPPLTGSNITDLRVLKGSTIIGDNTAYGSNRASGTAQQVFTRPYSFITGDLIIVQAHHEDTVSRSLSVTLSDGCWASVEYLHSGVLGST